ncbi:MAG: mechanosensitive ion channel [Lachnospiraceae bacterium]|nr:mechanosensitive ion channel [Lachnospiraceae bacterium]
METILATTVADKLAGFDFATTLKNIAMDILVPALLRIIGAILVFIIAKFVIKHLMNLIKKLFEKSKLDGAVKTFLLSIIKAALYVLLIIGIVEILGVATATIVSVVASAGLAIGLALQGSLSNFAGGVLILVMKPFKLGDYIIASGVEGTVVSMDVFYTKIRTTDYKDIVIPNGMLSNNTITNVSAQGKRRLDIIASASYNADIEKVKQVLTEICKNCTLVRRDEEVRVFVSQYASSSIDYNVRFWVDAANYWDAKFAVTESIKKEFDRNGIEIPYSKLDVNILNKD